MTLFAERLEALTKRVEALERPHKHRPRETVVPFEDWEKELAKLPRIGKAESPRDRALSALVAAMGTAGQAGTRYPMPAEILAALNERGWDITQRRGA
jgi:hypothetical protein